MLQACTAGLLACARSVGMLGVGVTSAISNDDATGGGEVCNLGEPIMSEHLQTTSQKSSDSSSTSGERRRRGSCARTAAASACTT